MKNSVKRIWTASIAALTMLLAACFVGLGVNLTASADAEDPVAVRVELTSYTSIMEVDEIFQFSAEVTLDDGTTTDVVTWSSSDEEVIFIGNDEEFGVGVALALAGGNATITATAGDVSASIDVLVSDEAVLVEGVTIDPAEVALYVDDTAQLSAVVLPEDATDKTVTWKSDNEAVATVDENGLVTAVGAGEAIITVTTNDHMETSTCTVTVTAYGEATLSAE